MKAHAAPVICFWSLAYDSLEVRGAVECTIGRAMAGAGTAKTGAAGGGRNAVRRLSTYSLFIAPLFTNALVLLRVPLIRRLRCGSWISPNRFLLRRFWRHC